MLLKSTNNKDEYSTFHLSLEESENESRTIFNERLNEGLNII